MTIPTDQFSSKQTIYFNRKTVVPLQDEQRNIAHRIPSPGLSRPVSFSASA